MDRFKRRTLLLWSAALQASAQAAAAALFASYLADKPGAVVPVGGAGRAIGLALHATFTLARAAQRSAGRGGAGRGAWGARMLAPYHPLSCGSHP
jgi:hypothetical protein